jgi:hypothetical protein
MKGTDRLRSGLGYAWAGLCLVIVLATFIGLNFWSEALARATGVKISPWFSGGEVLESVPHEGYQTLLHRPVFDGLLAARAEGFVQIDWVPQSGRALPSEIEEDFDIDRDGVRDLTVQLDTAGNRATLVRHAPWVLGADDVIASEQERILRVRLRNMEKRAVKS